MGKTLVKIGYFDIDNVKGSGGNFISIPFFQGIFFFFFRRELNKEDEYY